MLPWVELGRATVPGEADALVLLQRGTEYVIRLGTSALMSSTAHGSEEALAELACAPFGSYGDARVLIGGLGMGFTLAAALRSLPATARVEVAELVPAVVEWNRGPLAHLAGTPLADPRVTVHAGEVGRMYHGLDGAYDSILLDVDNGPDGLTRAGNDWLYSLEGLRAALRALKGGGVFGVWSVAPDEAFTQRLRQVGFAVDAKVIRARRNRGGRHTLWLGTKPAGRRR
ncbi:MAG: hypothetical protein IT348_19020 [Candidatus Eisenbacteria bacterium]|nr:hypothetical protein [Candidatus Eisenbacteria bacterium]